MNQLAPRDPRWLWGLVLCCLLAGLGLRLYGLDDNMLDFHPMRNYRGAIGGRHFYEIYLDTSSSIEQRQTVAAQWPAAGGILEPPLMESLAAGLYKIVGAEDIRLVRAFSAVSFVIGGLFLFLVAKDLLESFDQALFALSFYCLTPFGVTASRVYQIDPLMVLTLCAGLWFIWRYHQQPTDGRLAAACITAAFSLFIKPLGIYFLSVPFLALMLFKHKNIWRAIFNRDSMLYLLISLMPMAVYYGTGLIGRESLQANAQAQFVPALLLTRAYWAGLVEQISQAVGLMALLGGLLGTITIKRGLPSTLAGSLWLAYGLFVLTFTYLTSTHSYYHLQLIPITALSLAALFGSVIPQIARHFTSDLTRGFLIAGLVMACTVASAYTTWWRHFRGVYEADDPNSAEFLREIGGLVEHSTNAIYLTESNGMPLEYYAVIDGAEWPVSAQAAQAPFEQRWEASGADAADYFIVTLLADYANQPDLQAHLSRYPTLAQTPQYIIYDLRDEQVQR